MAKSPTLQPQIVASIQQQVLERVEPLLAERFYLVDVAFEREAGQFYLRLFVEGRGFKISLDDCADISRALDPEIEALPYLSDFPYTLEVSSPGAFRRLTTAREFAFYQGHPVKVERLPEAPAKKGAASAKKVAPPQLLHQGILSGYDAEASTVFLTLNNAGETISVSLADPNTAVTLNPALPTIEYDTPLKEETHD